MIKKEKEGYYDTSRSQEVMKPEVDLLDICLLFLSSGF